MWTRQMWLVLAVLGVGCGSRVYTIPPEEARRAALELRPGRAVVVTALNEGGWEVPIEIRSDDQFEVLPEPGQASQPFWLGAGQLGTLDGAVGSLRLHHDNPGPGRLAIGGGMLGGLTFLNLVVGLGIERPTYGIPFVGPGLMMRDSIEAGQECEDGYEDSCGEHDVALVFALLDLLAQVAGAGMLVAGAVTWEGGRELDIVGRDGHSVLRLSLEPVRLGEGGVGGLLVGRF
jgi:hypothetical protein